MGQINARRETATPDTPASGYDKLYPTADGWKHLDDAGVEKLIALLSSALTQGRIIIVDANGQLADDANLTFDGSVLAVGETTPPSGAALAVGGDIVVTDGAGERRTKIAQHIEVGDGIGSMSLGVLRYSSIDSNTQYVHIKTPILKTAGNMFDFTLTGYSYGSGKIIELRLVGYMYATTQTIINTHFVDVAGSGFAPTAYIGSDDYVYLRFGLVSTYFLSLVLSSTRTLNGVQYQYGDFSVILSSSLTL